MIPIDEITNLQPYQAVEYDAATCTITKITEYLIPIANTATLQSILCSRTDADKITVRRMNGNYKVTFMQRVEQN